MERYYLLIDERKEEKSLKEKKAEIEAQDAIMAARLLKTPYNSPLTRSSSKNPSKTTSKVKKPSKKEKKPLVCKQRITHSINLKRFPQNWLMLLNAHRIHGPKLLSYYGPT